MRVIGYIPRVTLLRGPMGRLLGCWLLASSALWMFMVSAGVYAFDRSGASGTGAVTVARLLPAMLAAPFAGTLVDRLDRGRLVGIAAVVSAVGYATAAAVVVGHGPVIGVVAAAVLSSIAGSPIRPALESLLPALARTPAEITRGTAWWSAADSSGFLLGAGAGGLLLVAMGPGEVMAVAEGLVVLAAALALYLPQVTATAADDPGESDGVLAGLRAVRGSRLLHAPVGLFVGLLVLEGASDVLLVALAISRLHLGSGGPGLLYALWGVGGLVASFALLVVVRRAGYGRALLVGALVFAVALGVCGLGGVALAVVAMVPAGLGFALVESAVLGIVPRLADDAVVGRVYGVLEVLYAGVSALGALIAPLLIHAIGVRGGLLAVGGAYAVLAVLTVARCAELDRGEQVAARVRDLLHGVPFLTALPLPRLERLVRDARSVTVAADGSIIRAGEAGQEFFVVDTGEVQVVEYGRTQGPGDGFGEIALLRDVPRTATVRALADTQLWAVSRATFLAAVGAVANARTLADDVVAEHLSRPRLDDVVADD